MPSLRKRVSSYFRQLSFHNEPREKRHNLNENSFITKYLQGEIKLRDGPPIVHGKNPTDLPNYDICPYRTGPESIVGCYTGPSGGCTTIQRQEKHLSMGESEIEFIDNPDNEEESLDQRYSICSATNSLQQSPAKLNSTTTSSNTATPSHRNSAALDITSMQIRVAGQTYLVTSNKKIKFEEKQKNLQKSLSQSSLATLPAANINEPPIKTQKSSDVHSILANPNYVSAYATLPRLGSKQQIQGNLSKELKDNNGNTSEGGALASVAALGDLTSIHGFDKETVKSDDSFTAGGVLKSKSAGNPFRHTISGDQPKKRKEGKIIRIANRPTGDNDTLIHMSSPTGDVAASATNTAHAQQPLPTSTKLPTQFRRSSEYAFGVAHSLYDKNPITGKQNGDPIADCFGLISRKDSAVIAVADGVNWGEKACIAAKSAIHASLHYLNTTLFHDSTLFTTPYPPNHHLTSQSTTHLTTQTTRDVFIALLRAFNCAHDLILERGGMLTTLTVAVVLPVKGRSVIGAPNQCDVDDETDECGAGARKGGETRLGSLGGDARLFGGADAVQQRYVCCVCNVGDTLAYVYSQRDGIRELTKGSHDINCNRDMRDALGALGPVDGHNPELSNLTLSITTVQRGDIILVASDGLTDNFDPNVCKFTVSANTSSVATNTNTSGSSIKKKDIVNPSATRKQSTSTTSSMKTTSSSKLPEPAVVVLQVPVKPPRKTKNYIAMNRESVSSRSSASSQRSGSKTSLTASEDVQANPLIMQFLTDNSIQSKQPDVRDKDVKSNVKVEQVSAVKINANKQVIPVQKSVSMKNVPVNQGKMAQSGNVVKPAVITRNPSSSSSSSSMVAGFNFLRSKTLIDFRPQTSGIVTSISKSLIARNNDGIPYVTPLQRYELTLLLMEDILKRGITGREEQCVTARKLCQELYNFTISLTNAKRKTLEEDSDLYYNQQQTNATTGNAGTGGVLVELGALERKARRKRALERVQALPGKLDHVTVVACNVGMW